MSARRATQCVGKSSPSGRSSIGTASPLWAGKLSIPTSPLRLNDEWETSRVMYIPRVSSPAASERLFRSQETVKAWLESSPTSVLDDHHLDGEVSAHSSFESYNSSPVGSPFLQSASSSRFLSPCPSVPLQAGFLSPSSSTNHLSGPIRVRAISPPRCPAANRNPNDVSRIDAAQSTYFLSLAFKRAQKRAMSTNVRDEAEEECDSPRSDFSLTSEWQNMLAAGTAAGMSTRDCDSSGNYSDYENPSNVLKGSDAMVQARRAHAQVMKPEPCQVRSMELPKPLRQHDPSLPQRYSAPQQRRSVIYDSQDLDRISGRISERSRTIEESYSRRMQHHRTMKQPQVREVRRPGLFERMQNDIAMAFGKTEEQKAIANAKRAEKAAAKAAGHKLTRRRSTKFPRGCLFLG